MKSKQAVYFLYIEKTSLFKGVHKVSKCVFS